MKSYNEIFANFFDINRSFIWLLAIRITTQKYLHFFFLSSLITAFICVSGIIGYAIFPKLAIQILFGSKYIEGAQYLVWFALFISLFTLTQLFISLFL